MLARVGVVLAVMALVALGLWLLSGETAVRQPIEFPHKTHLELEDSELECTSCHDRAEKSAVAGRPATSKCLSCHSGEEDLSEEEKKLQAFGENDQEVPWRRVWRLPRHVFFSHRIHVAVAKVKCQTCHGPMETLKRPPPRALKKLKMDDCISCHEHWEWPEEAREAEMKSVVTRRVSIDCNSCHR